MATIILTGGGTAGHVTPNLAILPFIKKHFNKIYYFGSESGMEKELAQKAGLKYFVVPCAKLQRKFTVKNLSIPFKVIQGVKTAERLIKELKPDVVFSKGGYVAVPTVIAAKKKGVPVISHESDYTIGLANRMTAKYCQKVLTSFPDTAKTVKNGEYVGSPLKNSLFTADRKTAKQFFNFPEDKPVLLVTGGSSGAKTLNDILRNSLKTLLKTYNVIHICGKGNLTEKSFGKGYCQTEFTDNIEYAFTLADLCVTRAGSNTLFELLSLKIPCVLIPLPKGVSRGDQVLNAKYFQKLGLVSVLPQDVLTEESLVFNINSLYTARFKIKENFKKHPIINASEKIADILKDQSRKN